jgi:hypothetical protein
MNCNASQRRGRNDREHAHANNTRTQPGTPRALSAVVSAHGRAARRSREAGEEGVAVEGEKRAWASRAATRGGDRAAASMRDCWV